MTISLRDYQEDGVAGIRREFRHTKRVLYQAPTGSGKTRVFSHIAEAAAAKGRRITIVAHRHQIVDQISEGLASVGLRHGLIAAGHTLTAHPIQVAMIQTLDRRIGVLPTPDMVITDECHHGVSSQYKRMYAKWHEAFSLGVTATPERLDGKGLGDVYDVIVRGPEMRYLMDSGYLADYDYYNPDVGADMAGLHTKYGDNDLKEMAGRVDKPAITGSAIEHWRAYLNNEPTIAFCVNTLHAENVAEQFRSEGIRSQSIDGKMSVATQKALIRALADGTVKVLTSCNLISEGVDVPVVSGAMLLTLTQSLSNFLQRVGRTFRIKPRGGRAVVLDHMGHIPIHGKPCKRRDWSLDGRTKRDPDTSVRQCDLCYRSYFPGDKIQCEFGAMCAMAAGTANLADAIPDEVAGHLVKYTDTPDWSRGWSLDEPGGYALNELEILAAGDPAKLTAIAKARGYHWRWAVRAAQRHTDRLRLAAAQ